MTSPAAYEKIDNGRVSATVWGNVSEVPTSVVVETESIKINSIEVLSAHIIARPHKNLEYVLPIRHTEEVESYRPY